MSRNLHVAIVGATGAVGVEMIKTLEKRKFPISKLTLLASARSAGKSLPFMGEEVKIQELKPDSFSGVDVALFSAGGSISKEYAPHAVSAGAVVVDNSSAFRMDDNVPLVVPEINGDDIKKSRGIIANPNCTTAITLMALWPLHVAFRVKRVIASSYQAVSGTGAQAIEELRQQVDALAAGKPIEKKVYPQSSRTSADRTGSPRGALVISPDDLNIASLERAYNWLEVGLWGLIASTLAKRAFATSGKRRSLLAIAATAFGAFSVSDVIEVYTGSWWEPPWLLVLKVACVATALLVWREWHRSFSRNGASR